ncbi:MULTISPECIES: hypothetical protein [unclassified Mesorhizobium]|uniref:hypothetical protein n=1 Tax=unclassified Mesorhizobium TaxID=325217 RepID=UPI0013E2D677|nr:MULTISPECIES: hypothetical protein [unclassified Mesorhizobium]
MGYFGASGLNELIFNDMMFIEFVKRDAAKIPGAARGDPQAELDFGGGDQGVTSCTTMSSSNLEWPNPEPNDRSCRP